MSGTLMIAAAIVITIAAAVILLLKFTKRDLARQEAEMRSAFEQVVDEQKLTISDKDGNRNTIIAIDELKMLLLFIKYTGNTVTYELIPLTRVTDCIVKRKCPPNSPERKDDEYLTETHLSFKLINNATIDLPVYKESQDGLYERAHLDEMARRWQSKIKRTLIVQC
jgi:hypothetical protein